MIGKVSGHSKWSQIKRQKGAADIKRGKVFTRIANSIIVAVREGAGGDPGTNFKLRLAIDQARSMNMPKENIQRAIDRGLGKGGSDVTLEEVVYEGFGPGKVAIMVEAVTDNRNRTTSEVKNTLERSGGNLGLPGSVSWMFSEEGVIVVAKNGKTVEEIFDLAADAGAEDVDGVGLVVEVYVKPDEIESVKRVLVEQGLRVQSAEISKKPSTTTEVADLETAKKILSLMEKLEELDDVQKVWSNFDIPESLLEGIQGS